MTQKPTNLIPLEAQEAHKKAVAQQKPGYQDPATGFFVMTEAYLRDRGYCCGNGCRHCPYPATPT